MQGETVTPLVLRYAMTMLSEILRVAPSQQRLLVTVLQRHCPHQRQPVATQEAYLHGILQLAFLYPSMRDDIVCIALEHCTKVSQPSVPVLAPKCQLAVGLNTFGYFLALFHTP